MKLRKELIFKTKNGVELYAYMFGNIGIFRFESSDMKAVKAALNEDLTDANITIRQTATLLLFALNRVGN